MKRITQILPFLIASLAIAQDDETKPMDLTWAHIVIEYTDDAACQKMKLVVAMAKDINIYDPKPLKNNFVAHWSKQKVKISDVIEKFGKPEKVKEVQLPNQDDKNVDYVDYYYGPVVLRVVKDDELVDLVAPMELWNVNPLKAAKEAIQKEAHSK